MKLQKLELLKTGNKYVGENIAIGQAHLLAEWENVWCAMAYDFLKRGDNYIRVKSIDQIRLWRFAHELIMYWYVLHQQQYWD